MSAWRHEQAKVEAALKEKGANIGSSVFEPSASEVEVRQLEEEVGMALPLALRRFLIEETRRFAWWWYVRFEKTSPFRPIFSGGFELGLSSVLTCERIRKETADEPLTSPSDPYDTIWQNKLGIIHVPNGDMIALDLSPENLGKVIYLSHEGGSCHGYVMANDVDDLFRRWMPLGCPGPEEFQWDKFISSKQSGIEPDGEYGRAWRRFLNLENVTS